MILKDPKYKRLLKSYARKIGLVLSFGLTTYKAFDYRQKYLNTELKNDQLRDENSELKNTYSDLLTKVVTDNYSIDDIALPMWYKIYDRYTDDFRMVRFNKAYRDAYNIKYSDYFLQNDKNVIDYELGADYQKNDRVVFEGNEMEVFDFYEGYLKEDGTQGMGHYFKWKVVKENNIYIYGVEIKRVK